MFQPTSAKMMWILMEFLCTFIYPSFSLLSRKKNSLWIFISLMIAQIDTELAPTLTIKWRQLFQTPPFSLSLSSDLSSSNLSLLLVFLSLNRKRSVKTDYQSTPPSFLLLNKLSRRSTLIKGKNQRKKNVKRKTSPLLI